MNKKKNVLLKQAKPMLLSFAIAVSLPAIMASAENMEFGYRDEFDFDMISNGYDIQSHISLQGAADYQTREDYSGGARWEFSSAQDSEPFQFVFKSTDQFAGDYYNIPEISKTVVTAGTGEIWKNQEENEIFLNKDESKNYSLTGKEEYDFSNADYAKLYTARTKTDKYLQKDYSKKADFSKEVSEVYQEWDLKRRYYEEANKAEEIKTLDTVMEARLTALEAENKANQYGLDKLFSADASSTNEELLTAWQEAKQTALDYEKAAMEKETNAASDTYLKNYYTSQAKRDAEKEADEDARTAALNDYIANRNIFIKRFR